MGLVTVPVIRSQEDLDSAAARIDTLWGAALGTPEGDELDVLLILVQAYEREHFPMPPPHPIDAVRFAMDQRSLTQQDLVLYFGSASRVSEFLNGKRDLSIEQVRKLHVGLGIPFESLLSIDPA